MTSSLRASLRLASLALLLLVALPALASAQKYAVDRGSLLVGGSASWTSSDLGGPTDNRASSVYVNPFVQYFVAPGLAVGGDVSLRHNSNGSQATKAAGLGPAVTYYFGRSQRSVYPFLSANVQYLRGFGDGYSNSTTGYAGSGGAVVMLAEAVGLNGSLYYRRARLNRDDWSNTVGIAFGISAFIF